MKKNTFKKSILTVLLCCIVLSCSNDDDTPENSAPVIETQNFEVLENALDTDVIGTVIATDPNKDDLTFSIKANSDGLFEITEEGILSLVSGRTLDFETSNTHSLSIEVSDGKTEAEAVVSITVIDVDESNAPEFNAQTFQIEENASRAIILGTLNATDPQGKTLTFAWEGNTTATFFEIDSQTGDITYIPSGSILDFEVTPQYVLTAIASNGESSTRANITIEITDGNDRPEAVDQSFTVPEDIDDTVLIGQLTASDQDGDALTYSVDIDFDLLFDLSTSGEIRLRRNKMLDFETKTSHAISFFISDGQETITRNITINVTDVVEPLTGRVSTLAGSTAGDAVGVGTVAQFDEPSGLFARSSTSFLVVDILNNRIKQVEANGTVSNVIQYPDFGEIVDVVEDTAGNLYVSDALNNVIWKLTRSVSFGQVAYRVTIWVGSSDFFDGSTDGTGNAARFSQPAGLTIDSANNIYVADSDNGAIRKVTPSGVVTTLTNEPNVPVDLVVGGTDIYFADNRANYIGKVSSTGGSVTIIAGKQNQPGATVDGPLATALMNSPRGLDKAGDLIYFTSDSHVVRVINLNDNTMGTVAGTGSTGNTDGLGVSASFNGPRGIVALGGKLYVADSANHRIRKIE